MALIRCYVPRDLISVLRSVVKELIHKKLCWKSCKNIFKYHKRECILSSPNKIFFFNSLINILSYHLLKNYQLPQTMKHSINAADLVVPTSKRSCEFNLWTMLLPITSIWDLNPFKFNIEFFFQYLSSNYLII